MAYLKPNWFARTVFNPLAMRFGIAGSVGLTTRGRRTGLPRRVPVLPVDHAGHRYLVSPRGDTEWVRNLRASGGGELRWRGGGPRSFRAVEIPVAERDPVLAAYREKAGRAVSGLFAKLPDAADHPVFRID